MIKPCPLCGGYAHIDSSGPTYFRKHIIYCEGCDMYFALDSHKATQKDLIDAFNRRVTDGKSADSATDND